MAVGGHNMEECRSCPNIMTSLCMFANPAQQYISRFIRKNALMIGGWHFGGFG